MNIHECPSAGGGTHGRTVAVQEYWFVYLSLPAFMAGGNSFSPHWMQREKASGGFVGGRGRGRGKWSRERRRKRVVSEGIEG